MAKKPVLVVMAAGMGSRYGGRHGNFTTHRSTGQSGNNGCADCNTGRRAVLRNCAFGEMNMDILCFIEVLGNSKAGGKGANIAKGSLRRFFHHITQVACEVQLAAAFYNITLYFQCFSAHTGPGQAGNKANRIAGRQLVRQEFLRPHQFRQIGTGGLLRC